MIITLIIFKFVSIEKKQNIVSTKLFNEINIIQVNLTILLKVVRESYSLYVPIYIFCVVVS